MDLLIVPVPIFNRDIAVEAYYFRYQKGNDILNAKRGAGGMLDGAMVSEPLQMLDLVGVEAVTMGKPIFVPIDNYLLLSSLEKQCRQDPGKIIFLLDGTVRLEIPYLERIRQLRDLGFRFAIKHIDSMQEYAPVLLMCDYVFFDFRTLTDPQYIQLHRSVREQYPKIGAVYTHISSRELFESAKDKLSGMYEGRFYRVPLTKGEHTVTPLQANQINLMNIVRDENFEFDDVAKVVQRDTALTISLLRLVNSPYMGLRNKVKTISHAVTMLGQDEVRRWITTAVSKLLSSEKPSEISRLSLVRARFCELLAPMFHLRDEGQSLFLMGLFSVLDAILEMPMDEALKKVHVSDTIYEALVDHKGPYYQVYEFLLQYESANWNAVCRTLILCDCTTEQVYDAYLHALLWYRDLIAVE